MSEYANKLSSIAEKKNKIIQEETRLIEKRKKEIGNLAERFNLLTASDDFLTGLFIEAQLAAKENSEKIKQWENLGGRFHKTKRANRKETQKDASEACLP